MKPSLIDIAQRYDTDKGISHNYLQNYERHLSHLRDQPILLLEIGVLKGGSLLMWADYFKTGTIIGIDINSCPLQHLPPNVSFHQGSQSDASFLQQIARSRAPGGFDVIIDDASHYGTLTRDSYKALFTQHLKPGGLYVIEDWGTGYWGSWPDGAAYRHAEPAARVSKKSILRRAFRKLLESVEEFCQSNTASPPVDPNFATHNFGMVGFVKELVDEAAWGDISNVERSASRHPPRNSAIASLTLSQGQVFVVKA